MNKLTFAARILVLGPAVLALAACGSSDSADEAAQAENVELPAEESVPPEASVAPVTDETAAATAAASEGAAAGDAATKAVEDATKAAEKKM